MPDSRPIAVFDSGIGGLTVLNELARQLPFESFCYLGDTARLPYGTKSPEVIVQYSLRAAQFLQDRVRPKALVVACNTSSTYALEALRLRFPTLPIVGVIEPTAREACQRTNNGKILVLATESTIQGQSFQAAIQHSLPSAHVICQPATVLVAMAEEGWHTGDVVCSAIRHYVKTALSNFNADMRISQQFFLPDTVVLGCTHFPILRQAFSEVFGPEVALVGSAEPTAQHVKNLLHKQELQAPTTAKAQFEFCVTDSPERFARVANHFLCKPILGGAIQSVDL